MNDRGGARPPDRAMTPFMQAFLWTAIPVGALSLLSTVGAAASGLYVLWFGAALIWLVLPFVAIGFAIAGRKETAAGVLAGIGVGFVVLFATCFANLGTVDIGT